MSPTSFQRTALLEVPLTVPSLTAASHNMPDLLDLPRSLLEEHAQSLEGCLLYLDAGAAEVIAANVGLDYLLGKGVPHVCALETVTKR